MSKKNKQKHYWFYLDNYVHLSLKGDCLLFYNPLTGKILEYQNPSVIELVKKLQSPKNLLVVRLDEEEFSNPGISQFVTDMRANFMGDLIDASYSQGKPMQMMPVVKIQRDAQRMKKTPSRSVGEDMMKYLREISLYINGECSLDCSLCGSAYRQFLCCTRGKNLKGYKGCEELEILSIKNLFAQLVGSSLERVNILGGNIFQYSNPEALCEILKGYPFDKVFYLHYLNLAKQAEKVNLLTLLFDSSSLELLITFPVNEDRLKIGLESLRRHMLPSDIHLNFIIADEVEGAAAEALISRFQPDNYSFHPFFNGKNRDFFEKNIYLEKEDLQEANPTFREIQIRRRMNPLNFGTLTVLSNGHIHANVNVSRLGILESDSIYDAVYKEMHRGTSWRRIRKGVEPCKRCIFEVLCPPLSNYEYALGRNDLCHIKQSGR